MAAGIIIQLHTKEKYSKHGKHQTSLCMQTTDGVKLGNKRVVMTTIAISDHNLAALIIRDTKN